MPQIYKIEIHELHSPDFIDRIAAGAGELLDKYKDLPLYKQILYGIPAATLGAGAFVVEAPLIAVGAAVTATGVGVSALGAWLETSHLKASDAILIQDKDSLSTFQRLNDDPFENGYYITHPRNSKILLPAKTFNASMQRQQIDELINYFRSTYKVTYLEIESYIQNDSSVELEAHKLEFEARKDESRYMRRKYTTDKPVLVPSTSFRFWDDILSSIHNIAGGPSGHLEYDEQHDVSFGLNISIAEKLKIKTNWFNTHCLRINMDWVSE